MTLSAMERCKKGRFKRTIKELSQFDKKKPEELESEFDHFERTIKELSQFDNKKPEDLESEFDHFDLIIRIQVCHNIVDLDFVYKQLLDGHKACKTTLSLT